MDITREEGLLQGLLASAGFVDAGLKRLLEGKEEIAIKRLSDALIILQRLIKSLRGF